VELFPRHGASRRQLARALETSGRTAEAEAAYRAAVSLDPAGRAGRRALCRFLATHGGLTEAHALLDRLREEEPGDPLLASLERLLGSDPAR
jgi:Flp pilus assembly protein TadD